MKTIKILAFLALVAVGGLAGYAYFGDMSPDRRDVVIQIGGGDGG